MMARKPASLAERLRAYREEMALSMELGCTPREARAELDRRQAWQRHVKLMARAAALKARPTTRTSPDQEADRPTPWWNRD